MASNHHTDEVFRKKRVPKNPIKFKLTLNEEQKIAKEEPQCESREKDYRHLP